MALNLTSGFRRLFVVLTAVWIILCVVVLPLCMQWDHQRQALNQYHADNKACDAFAAEFPGSAYTTDCYKKAMDDLQVMLKFYAFSKFWIWPVGFWQLFIPLAVVPPFLVGLLGMLGVWIGRGFRQSPRPDQS